MRQLHERQATTAFWEASGRRVVTWCARESSVGTSTMDVAVTTTTAADPFRFEALAPPGEISFPVAAP